MASTRTAASGASRTELPRLPTARGPLTRWLFRRFVGKPTSAELPTISGSNLVDEDFQLALHCLSELDYRSYADVDPAIGRDPLVALLRTSLEDSFLNQLRDDAREATALVAASHRIGPGAAVDAMLQRFEGPSLSRFMASRGTRKQFIEFMVHRSAYQLKEADPHTLGIARLVPGARKDAYVEIQFDEYGKGLPGQSHAELFAEAMAAAGLDSRYGHYLDLLPGVTLATGNLLAVLASRRDLLAPLVGHLALFEMTSVEPMARYARAARHHQLPEAVARFYDVHVEADARHGWLARRILLGDVIDDDLDPTGLVWGALALLRAEDRFARHLLGCWSGGRTSLRNTQPRRPDTPQRGRGSGSI